MLLIVRISAVFGFFAFLLAFLGLVSPESLAHPTPAVLYSKFAVGILISIFALRRAAGPVESYESRKSRTLSTIPSTTPKSAPATLRSAPAMSKGALAPALAVPVSAPPGPGTLPKIQPVPPNAPPPASAPAASSNQNCLSDVQAPPVPNRSNPLCAPPPGVVKERLGAIGSTFIMGAIFIAFFYLLGITWVVYAFLIFFSLAILILFFARNAPVGACPYCGGLIQRYNRLRPEPVLCEQCGEISKFENERFSPCDPNAVSATPIFRSALFEDAVWPNGCVVCGAPPTRFDDARAVRYQARRLATLLVSSIYLPHPAARITGVPYCEKHGDAIKVVPPKEMFAFSPWKFLPGFAKTTERRRTALLVWRSLPMMRRYLEANRNAKRGVSTGYREPNLLQKTVSGVFAKPGTHGPSAAFPRANPTKPGA